MCSGSSEERDQRCDRGSWRGYFVRDDIGIAAALHFHGVVGRLVEYPRFVAGRRLASGPSAGLHLV